MFELVWASFINVAAPVLGTVIGVIAIFLLLKLLKKLGIQVNDQQMEALYSAAGHATRSVEAWAAKKAEESGAKPSSKEKAAKAVEMVKGFLSNSKLYNLGEDQILKAIEAKVGEDVIDLDIIAEAMREHVKKSKELPEPDAGN